MRKLDALLDKLPAFNTRKCEQSRNGSQKSPWKNGKESKDLTKATRMISNTSAFSICSVNPRVFGLVYNKYYFCSRLRYLNTSDDNEEVVAVKALQGCRFLAIFGPERYGGSNCIGSKRFLGEQKSIRSGSTRYGEIKDKQSKVDRVKQLSLEIENETIDPEVNQPFVKIADALTERWNKNKEMLENYGEKDAGSKASSSNCCIMFMKKRLVPVWYS
ncbi:hypothetical protein OS493_005971 [Desmophyllum pertusum]|uniref:Uncharacterized protein n=1 Tax=Desmophyllum pertusum TaxID=174260 RepID=A0A9W9YFM4_9CNID|nr:hypothetical protein OS493_005971 [Desmophyllum pertusum]